MKIFCKCLRYTHLASWACFVCKIPPLISIYLYNCWRNILFMFLPESFVDNFQYCIMTWNKFQEECLLPPFTNRNYGLQADRAMQYSTITAWGSSEKFVLIIQERLPGVVKWASSGKKTKKSVFVPSSVQLDLIWLATVVTQCKCKAWPMFVTYVC